MKTITEFKDEYRFLSNFWPVKIMFEGITFHTVEHAYQAAKTLNQEERLRIANTPSPYVIKRMGRTLTLRQDWDEIKFDIMLQLVIQKFWNHEGLRYMLIDTKNAELIEGNQWNDTFWGVCRGKGQNNLGKILMAVRDSLNKVSYA